ncbi:MAG: hypothetical protein V4773_14740 [Verrucomicrobiota bacterium]
MLRSAALLALAIAALALAGCYREASDATASRTLPRYSGNEPWSIDGVRLGQSYAEVHALLGEPVQSRDSMGKRTVRWDRRDTYVTFDAADRAVEVMGSSVQAGGKIIVSSGASEAEVVQILGPGKVQKSTSPKGGGIISIGSEHTGTTVIYERDGARFELSVFGQTAGRYRVFQPPNKK